MGSYGPFQLEATIQAAHCYRARTGIVPWREIVDLYAALVQQYATIGAQVGMGVAIAYSEEGPTKGIEILQRIDPDRVRTYQPYWAALGHLYAASADLRNAKQCLERALALTTHPRLRPYLQGRLAVLAQSSTGSNK